MRIRDFYSTLLIIIGLFIMNSCLATATSSPNFTDPAKPIMLKPGQHVLTLTLQSNRTTGFQWIWLPSASSRMIIPIDQKYRAASNGLMGAPGDSVWRFKVMHYSHSIPVIGYIALVYARPWVLPLPKPVIFTVITV